MFDKIKLIVDDVLISEDFLQDKKLYSAQNKRKNKQWFVFDYKKLELLHFFRYKNSKIQKNTNDEDEDDDEDGYLNDDNSLLKKIIKIYQLYLLETLVKREASGYANKNIRAQVGPHRLKTVKNN